MTPRKQTQELLARVRATAETTYLSRRRAQLYAQAASDAYERLRASGELQQAAELGAAVARKEHADE